MTGIFAVAGVLAAVTLINVLLLLETEIRIFINEKETGKQLAALQQRTFETRPLIGPIEGVIFHHSDEPPTTRSDQ
ncbi:hypothetical protein [Corynebacterium sp. TAE3-ERU16]|uniref:hypothetical protein n=1 Tax=Corynebacterium sp. TAE3-ERU16 TaxID=2849493 RepID=UPI001C440524|nr:hypothetical protein [Corynebacterium sp. TAE3-ERU16]MBV7292359.1 hypothetical protein [Corynebacterium sp. TAE3-ERU16]